MEKRVFLSIIPPENILNQIEIITYELEKKLKSKFSFVKKENWHLTLLFLGYQNERSLSTIRAETEEILKTTEKININLSQIDYEPETKNPRMIWLKTDNQTSVKLHHLSKKIKNRLQSRELVIKAIDHTLQGHVTLLRIPNSSQRQPFPPIQKTENIYFLADKVYLMSSSLKPRGAEYGLLETFKLAGVKKLAQDYNSS